MQNQRIKCIQVSYFELDFQVSSLGSYEVIYKACQCTYPISNRECRKQAKVTLRPIVSRPVCLGVRRPSGTRDQFLFLLEILFRQLLVRYFVAPSLTRGRVCILLLLASAVPLSSAVPLGTLCREQFCNEHLVRAGIAQSV
jgi:hypothetical protein